MVGVLSLNEIPVIDLLANVRCSLLEQAKIGRQGDGWGIGYYVENNLKVVKSEKAVYENVTEFLENAKQIKSKLFVAHVRKASNPRKLPREVLISVENSQPFYYQSYVFVHNGSIEIPDQLQEALGQYKNFVKGQNDSEVLFWLLIKLIKEKGNIVDALKQIEHEIWSVYEKVKEDVDAKIPFSALNLIFSDGKNLYALNRFLYDPKITSFCYKETPYFVMTYHKDNKRIIVASEKMFDGDWNLLGDKKILVAKSYENRIEVQIEDA